MRSATILSVCLAGIGPAAFALEGRRVDSILLNGEWEFALGQGEEQAHTA